MNVSMYDQNLSIMKGTVWLSVERKKNFELITEGVYDTSLYECSILHSPNQDIDVGSGAQEILKLMKAASVHIFYM